MARLIISIPLFHAFVLIYGLSTARFRKEKGPNLDVRVAGRFASIWRQIRAGILSAQRDLAIPPA
ncbi:hypothetical protein AB4144_03470 [Rhizobiaceae sp. 2RAB30]